MYTTLEQPESQASLSLRRGRDMGHGSDIAFSNFREENIFYSPLVIFVRFVWFSQYYFRYLSPGSGIFGKQFVGSKTPEIALHNTVRKPQLMIIS